MFSLSSTIMASKMTLNFDVQVIVMSFISNRRDLLSFMQSSHTLYNAGVPYLLQFPNIINQRQISSFCDFMLSGGSSQLQALRQVSFPSSWVRYRVSSRSGIILRLVQVFNHAHFIKSLEIVECEELLRTHADVALAIISMKSLERLIISNVEDLTRNMFHRLKSPITHLDMSFFSTLSPSSHLDVTRANPVPVVANLASSLKDITFHRVHLDNRTTRFPNVKTLSMRISHGINAGCMTYTFPNLERLSFDSWPGSQDISDHVAQANHRMNKRTQYGNEWSYLEYLEGNLLDLYFLALNCRIGEVVVTEVTSARLSMLRDVLDDALPRRLNITLSTNSFNPKNLPVLITRRSRVKLTHFVITIILSYSSANPREVLVR